MSLLNKLKGNARVEELGFGIHDNCVIISASNEVKTKKDGSTINRSCYTTIGQVNAKGKITKNKEISWFGVDATSDMAYDNFFTQLDQTTELMDILYPPTAEGSAWDKAFNGLLDELEVEHNEAALRLLVSKTKTCKPFMKALGDLYADMINKKSGIDSTKLKLKLVIDKSAVYVQQPRYDKFVEPSDIEKTTLGFNDLELEYKSKADKIANTFANAPSVESL